MSFQPVIIGTRNTRQALKAGLDILQNDGSALDAVEEAVKVVELDENDWSVGLGGTPNLLGEIELDASICIGSNHKCGAVAGVKRHIHPISIARKVMELTPHVLMIGEGADDFADIVGLQSRSPMTNLAKICHQKLLKGEKIEFSEEDPERIQQIAKYYNKRMPDFIKDHELHDWYKKWTQKHDGGTVNVIALDSHGEIVSGVSTSGLALKLPGRVGDSPIIGAGNYADKIGAAACTGYGEGAIRLCLAYNVVQQMKSGKIIGQILDDNILTFQDVVGDYGMHIIALDRKSNSAASGTNPEMYYYRMTPDDSEPQMIPSSCPSTPDRVTRI